MQILVMGMNESGFTLIEVLVALGILSIGLTSLIVMSSEITRNTNHLQEKAIAHWVGQNVMAKVQMGLLEPPASPKNLKGSTHMLGQQWQWALQRQKTKNNYMDRIIIKVGVHRGEKENGQKREYRLLRVVGFVGVFNR